MIDLRGHMPSIYSQKWTCYAIYLLGNPIKWVLKSLRTGLIFARQSIWGVTCLGLLSWINVFPSISLEMPKTLCWNPQNRVHVYPRQSIWEVTCLHLLEKWTFSNLSPWKPQKCVLKSPEQGSFFQDDWFERSHAYVYSQNECFPIYLLGNCIIVCWNPQNKTRFSKMINLRGHMPMFPLKMNVFPSIFLATA